MSAIFGLLRLDGAGIDPSLLSAMSTALATHGVHGGCSSITNSVALGYRAATVQDADALAQRPNTGHADAYTIVLDGRVDGRDELVRALGLNDGVPARLSDAALLLHAYHRWGEHCLDTVAGEFAMALWDPRMDRLMLACSAPIARPLALWRTGSIVAFASRPAGLFALPGIRREVDEVALAQFLTFTGERGRRTLFRGVERLLPGECLVAGRGGGSVSPWWRPDLRQRLKLHGDAEYVDAFTEVLGQAVRDHLRGPVQPGIMLSGGLDSGTVAALTAEIATGPVRCYTEAPLSGSSPAIPENRYADETPLVRALAAMHPALELRVINGECRGLFSGIDRYFDYAGLPFRNAANRGWYETILQRAHEDGEQVLLTGDQGNLTASWGGDGLLAELVAGWRWKRALDEARALSRAGAARSAPRALLLRGLLPLLPAAPNRVIGRLVRHRRAFEGTQMAFLNKQFAAAHAEALRRDPLNDQPTAGLRRGAAELRMRVLLSTGTLHAEIAAGYRALFGVDLRVPLADRRLVEFCLAVPEEQQCRAGERRWLIRRAMADRLPAASLDSSRRGLQASSWFQTLSRERDLLLHETERFAADALTSHVLDVPRLRSTLEHWPEEPPVGGSEFSLLRSALPLALTCGRFLLWAQAAA